MGEPIQLRQAKGLEILADILAENKDYEPQEAEHLLKKVAEALRASVAERGPDEVAVMLNMDETGVLCHLMMGNEDFRNMCLGRYKPTGIEVAVLKRWLTLYEKLGRANDRLMGKDI